MVDEFTQRRISKNDRYAIYEILTGNDKELTAGSVISMKNIGATSNKQDIVKNNLIEWIKEADVGARLLSERELAVQFDVSRFTIRKAVDELVKLDLLKRVQGSGVYVKKTIESPAHKVCLVHYDVDELITNLFMTASIQQLHMQVTRYGGEFHLVAIKDPSEPPPPIIYEADGIITLCELPKAWILPGKPIMAFLDASHFLPSAAGVIIDDSQGGFKAADYLVSLGHKKLAFIGDTEHFYWWAIDRYKGVCASATINDLEKPLLINIPYNKPVDLNVARQINEANITGIVCANDAIALGTISVLQQAGLRVPEDVSVVGFDDLPVASLFQPPLTTIRIPLQEAALIAACTLNDLMSQGKENKSKRILLPVDLIIRESCAKPGKSSPKKSEILQPI